MDKGNKLSFVQGKKLSPADDLREELSRLEDVLPGIKALDSAQVVKLLHELDHVVATFEKLDPAGDALTAEWSRFQAVQGRLKQDASKLLKLLGGTESLARQRPEPAPPADHWWWYLDKMVAQKRQYNLKRISTLIVIVLVIVGGIVILLNTVFKPSPEAVARLNAEGNAYAAVEQEGDFAKALAAIDEGLAVAPNDPSMLAIKGVVLQLLGREAEAEDVFAQVKKNLNDPIAYHLTLAQVYLRLGQPEQTERETRAALALNDEFARSWLLLGQSLEMQGKYIEAIDAYETTGEIASQNDENEIYVMSRMALAHLSEALPALPMEGTTEPTVEPAGE